jgi:regulator of nucleoside diphosphate kinase
MSKLHPCQLTAKDHSILEMLLTRNVGHDETYLQLLHRKLSAARIVFEDAIGPQVATINSRVDFTVDGGFADNRILIHGKDNIFPGLTLPITTLRGLALLGMTAGETITIERAEGRAEALRLEWVSHQPEASRRGALYPPLPGGTATALPQMQGKPGTLRAEAHEGKESGHSHESERSANASGATIVLLSAHRKRAAGPVDSPVNHGDDDPGPGAA